MTFTLKTVPLRRKREGRTNYRKRIRLLASGKHRLVIRPTSKNIIAQIISYGPSGDKVDVGVTAYALEKKGWTVHKGNLPAAYLTGYLLGLLGRAKRVSSAMLDSGLSKPIKGSRIYACVAGVRDAGVSVPVDISVLPPMERIRGGHIAAYSKIKGMHADHQKKGMDPAQIELLFDKVKKALENDHERG